MFPSLVGLLGFRSSSPSRSRASHKSLRREFRPALEELEARAVPSISTLRQSLPGEPSIAGGHAAHIEVMSLPLGVQAQNQGGGSRQQSGASWSGPLSPQPPSAGQSASSTGAAQPPVLANIGGLAGLSKEELLEKIKQYQDMIKALENAGADDAGELKELRENLGKALDALLDLLHNR